jgi:diguanylate cyclase (GGDEF)-like protein
MRRCCREHDVVARLGGDEFAVIFWDLPEDTQTEDRRKTSHEHPREAQFMAERFRTEISQAAFEYLGAKGQGNLTISGGLATYPLDAKTAAELFEKADHAMLNAKRTGKNKITIVGQPMQ